MYDSNMVQPMRDEMIQAGFSELTSKDTAEAVFANPPHSALFFINSVCGCSAAVGRPGVSASLSSEIKPTALYTSFAGNDREAVQVIRENIHGYAPSSPCAALFRDGQLVYMMERHQIEGQTAENIASILKSAYAKYCGENIDESIQIFDPLRANNITVAEAKERIAQNDKIEILDVRENHELAIGVIENSQNVTNELASQILNFWERDREIIVYCAHGNRSLQAVQYLQQQGFTKVKSLEGGFAAWSK